MPEFTPMPRPTVYDSPAAAQEAGKRFEADMTELVRKYGLLGDAFVYSLAMTVNGQPAMFVKAGCMGTNEVLDASMNLMVQTAMEYMQKHQEERPYDFPDTIQE